MFKQAAIISQFCNSPLWFIKGKPILEYQTYETLDEAIAAAIRWNCKYFISDHRQHSA